MAMSVGKANASDQKVQAVLFLMDKLDSKYGIDGRKGDDTIIGLRRASEALKMGSMGEPGDVQKVEQALKDKLKDPAFRATALEKLKQIDPPTKDSIAATQVILAAAGHPMKRDFTTGMVTGKMDEATQFALAHTSNGAMDGVAVARAASIDDGLANAVASARSNGSANVQFAQGKDAIIVGQSAMNMSFQNAASGAVPAAPAASFESKSKVQLASAMTNG